MDWTLINWKLLVTQGVIGIVFGVVAMVWPLLALLWGVMLVVAGLVLRSAITKAVTAGAATTGV